MRKANNNDYFGQSSADCNMEEEDIITIHLGRVVSEELYNQIIKDIIKLLDRKYSVNAEWCLDS